MKNTFNVIEDVLIGMGITVSLIDIQQILSIVLIVLNVCMILVKVGLKIYDHVKTKKYDQIDDDLKEGIEGIEKIQEQTQHNDDSKESK